MAEAIVRARAGHPEKPVLAVLMGRQGLPEGRAGLYAAGIPAYVFPESAARALAGLCRHREWRERPPSPVEPLSVDRFRAEVILQRARAAGQKRLDEVAALELFTAYGIPTAGAELAGTEAAGEALISSEKGFGESIGQAIAAQCMPKRPNKTTPDT